MPGLYTSNPVYSGRGDPPEGGRYVDIAVNFPQKYLASYANYQISVNVSDCGLSAILSGFIDNSSNIFDVYITIADTNITIRIPANSQTTFPIITGQLNFIAYIYVDNYLGISQSETPYFNPLTLRLYNFDQDYNVMYTLGKNGYGRPTYSPPAYNVDTPGFNNPSGSGFNVSGAITNLTSITNGDRSRYRLYIFYNSGTGNLSIYSCDPSLVSYTFITTLNSTNPVYSEQQTMPGQAITLSTLAYTTTGACYFTYAVWSTSRYQQP